MSETNTKYLKWTIPEYEQPKRGRSWYIIAGVLILLFLLYSFFNISHWHLIWLGAKSNFLFALIILISAILIIINDIRTPGQINIELGPEGVTIGQNFYDYDDLKNFTIIYKPQKKIKNLYFEHKGSFHPHFSIPLQDLDALTVRNFLVKYLDENLERTQIPLSEQLTKMLKL